MIHPPNRPRQSAALIAAGCAGAIALSGCGTQLSALVLGRSSEAVVITNPAVGVNNADPDNPIVVTAANGRLTHVSVIGPKGEVSGALDETGTVWTSSSTTLTFNSEYRVQASAVDENGLATSLTNRFQTLQPSNTFQADVTDIADRSTVGVGMPLRVAFTRPIRDKAKIESRLKVYSSRPFRGAWSWNKERTMATFRPEKFWPGHTKIALRGALYGLEGAKGVFGRRNLSFNFSTGSSMILTVDADTLLLTVERDGKKISTIPVTTGKAGFATRSGTVAIMSKEGTVRMTDPTLRGTGEFYDLPVNYSMRIRPTGEFLHAAPWSTGSQGYSRVSHGCIGMSTGNASWLYSQVMVGDPVIVKNTGRSQELGNGITEFSVPWKQWLKQSATGAVLVGPGGGVKPAKDKRAAAPRKR